MPSGLSSKLDWAPQTQGKKRAAQGQSPLCHSVKCNSPGIQMFPESQPETPIQRERGKRLRQGARSPATNPCAFHLLYNKVGKTAAFFAGRKELRQGRLTQTVNSCGSNAKPRSNLPEPKSFEHCPGCSPKPAPKSDSFSKSSRYRIDVRQYSQQDIVNQEALFQPIHSQSSQMKSMFPGNQKGIQQGTCPSSPFVNNRHGIKGLWKILAS